MKVLMNAGPWLAVPPCGYGGIENVVATLIPPLRERGVQVVLASVGDSTIEVDELISVYDTGRFEHLQKPYNEVAGIALTHQTRVVAELRDRRDIDLVHDHVEVVGPAVLSAFGGPPVLHTLHWDLRKHGSFYRSFPSSIKVNGVSESQLARAPRELRSVSLGAVHLATPLVDAEPPVRRGEHLVVMGRVCRLKGQHIAARICQKLGLPLVLAGPVCGMSAPDRLDAVAGDPGHPLYGHDDVRYHVHELSRYVDGDLVRWVGAVGGADRVRLYASARAALFPLQWDEPGGTAVVEALALGVPPVGLRRGVLPELIEHGRTGLLADTEEEMAEMVLRVDEIDPEECRREARRRFSPAAMADRYLALYERVLACAGPVAERLPA
ncbi:glycosyltransferase [Thermostaphylospora chromogena]|uniref:Glycosyltransferase involved in cell wall bisynthesis n=1 Tax=Thermostaphylospora chromogena TaxID=35622 RepID=A0A1H1HFH9_9ACTN|nr:glycosyltransferase [Thermostaphylospora chromogena]SDR24109.1 Glycosyltransferase involved in cell wall bisynthesis [Thermostaphylospora chromogena]